MERFSKSAPEMSYTCGRRMLLAIDIGNSNIVWGVLDGAKLLADWRVGTDHSKTTDEYAILLLDLLRVEGISPDRVDGVILSSVVPQLTPLFEELSETYLHCLPLDVSHELESGLTIKYTNPREVGTDRIVNAAASYRQYGVGPQRRGFSCPRAPPCSTAGLGPLAACTG